MVSRPRLNIFSTFLLKANLVMLNFLSRPRLALKKLLIYGKFIDGDYFLDRLSVMRGIKYIIALQALVRSFLSTEALTVWGEN